ncbi:MAG: hypothetical protein Q4F95_03250 [Oscillospiraceae bacterium]|nr:hypothetical protein [Oscillospiraceae bacterium]
MIHIIKSDMFRVKRNCVFYFILFLAAVPPLLLNIAVRNGIRLGISVFSDMTSFTDVNDIVMSGIQYQKGLGLLCSIFISVYVSQEFSWKTWQNKYLIHRSRIRMYLSKTAVSILICQAVFVVYEITAFVCSSDMSGMISPSYLLSMANALIVYAALGAVLCMISILIKSSPAGTVFSCLYVLFSQSAADNILAFFSGKTDIVSRSLVRITEHGLYCTCLSVCSYYHQSSFSALTVVSPVLIIVLSTLAGAALFNKYEF